MPDDTLRQGQGSLCTRGLVLKANDIFKADNLATKETGADFLDDGASLGGSLEACHHHVIDRVSIEGGAEGAEQILRATAKRRAHINASDEPGTVTYRAASGRRWRGDGGATCGHFHASSCAFIQLLFDVYHIDQLKSLILRVRRRSPMYMLPPLIGVNAKSKCGEDHASEAASDCEKK